MAVDFRKEAVDHAQRRLAGEVVLAAPLPFQWLVGLAGVAMAVGFVFVCTATYSQKQTVEGRLVPERGLIRVSAHEQGVVEWLGVREGDDVVAGAPIARIKISPETAGGDTGGRLLASVEAETFASEAQNRAQLVKFEIQRRELASRRDNLVAAVAEWRRNITTIERREVLAQAKINRAEKLVSQGFLADAAVDDLRAADLTVNQELSSARASLLDLQRQLGDVDHELTAVSQDIAATRAAGAQSAAALDQKRVTTQAQATSIATAPMSGRILALPLEVGQTVASDAALAILTPRNSDLIAELYVPSRSIGFIREGQQVRLMYQAFPYQTFGAEAGVVTSVSRTVLVPDELGATGVAVKEPVFRVRVSIPRQRLMAYGKPVPLQPGMLLNADVVTDRRNLIRWILDPLYAAGRRP